MTERKLTHAGINNDIQFVIDIDHLTNCVEIKGRSIQYFIQQIAQSIKIIICHVTCFCLCKVIITEMYTSTANSVKDVPL